MKHSFVLLLIVVTMSFITSAESIPVNLQALTVGAIIPDTVVNTVDNMLLIEVTGYVDPVRIEIVDSGYGLLDATTGGSGVSFTLPSGFPVGTYTVDVHNGDGIIGTTTNELTVLSPTPTSTPTPTYTPEPTIFLRPQIMIQSYGVSATTLYPGQEIDLEMTLVNTGMTTARNVVVTFMTSDLFPRETGGVISIPDLAPSGTEEVWQSFTVNSSISTSEAILNVQAEYTDNGGTTYKASFDLTFPVFLPASTSTPTITPTPTPTLNEHPQIIIDSYSIDPDPLSPGAVAELKFELVNSSEATAYQVVTSLDFSKDSLEILAPTGSDMCYTEHLDPGEEITVDYNLVVGAVTEAVFVPFEVIISYSDNHNNSYQDQNTISLRVESYPAFHIELYNSIPDTIEVGDVFDLPIMIINIGQNDVNVNIVEVTSDQFTITNGTL